MDDEYGGLYVSVKSDVDAKVAANAPSVEVAAALVMAEGQVLAVHNEAWNNFTLPMTKRRENEEWVEAAERAALECIRSRAQKEPAFVMDVASFMASNRDSEIKSYHVRIYQFIVSKAALGKDGEWWNAKQFVENSGRTSPTAQHIMRELIKAAWNLGIEFK